MPEPRKGGRPPKFDDLKAQRIVNAVAACNSRRTAARLARIAPSTLFDWLARGRRGEPGYAEFSERVQEAEAKAEEALVSYVYQAAEKSPQVALQLLERRNPRDWAPRRVEPAAKTAAEGGASEAFERAKAIVSAFESADGTGTDD